MTVMVADEHLAKIGNIIGRFLLEHGGFSNGYCTWASGDVQIMSQSHLTLGFPWAVEHKMTLAAKLTLGQVLYGNVRAYMLSCQFPTDLTIKIRSKRIDEYGTYAIKVFYTAEHEIDLSKIATTFSGTSSTDDKIDLQDSDRRFLEIKQ